MMEVLQCQCCNAVFNVEDGEYCMQRWYQEYMWSSDIPLFYCRPCMAKIEKILEAHEDRRYREMYQSL